MQNIYGEGARTTVGMRARCPSLSCHHLRGREYLISRPIYLSPRAALEDILSSNPLLSLRRGVIVLLNKRKKGDPTLEAVFVSRSISCIGKRGLQVISPGNGLTQGSKI